VDDLRRKRNEVSEEIAGSEAGQQADDKVIEMRSSETPLRDRGGGTRAEEPAEHPAEHPEPAARVRSGRQGRDWNVEVKRWSPEGTEPRKLSFEPKPHWDLANTSTSLILTGCQDHGSPIRSL